MDPAHSPNPDDLRASDQDRERVAAQLHAAAADGRIDLDELGERLQTLYAARTHGELVPLTKDLPVPDTGAPPAPVARAGIVPDTGPAISVAVMSGCDRAGEWVVPARHTAFALMGGVDLDLRHARFAAAEVTITAVAIMGGIEITVPHDLHVASDGFGLMGGFDGRGAGVRHGGPKVRINGFALMGGVEIKRAKPPGPTKELET
ncbi:DUF1707 domain-containing protein [Pseudonocardia sp.]|uniref:DUF1707 SHOCT-like domain-containing protein n=1 Tax=Pseudonocardia sp. TaxID=60912 RepID=UPI00260386E0|nr:DUF1707 domain-containing protein [Pseudonocardia sp.]